MRRIAVVGSGGAGKSTFARELGAATGLAVIHLDRHFWRPGWERTGTAEWEVLQAELVAGENWIIDGNYGSTFDLRFARADAVIVIALPRWRCIARAMWRSARNWGRDIQATGCPERFNLEFLRWLWRFPVDSRPMIDAGIARHRHLQVIELTSPAHVRAYLAEQRA